MVHGYNMRNKERRCIALLVKYPEAGKVKTRLAAHYGDELVAKLYGCFIEDLLDMLRKGTYDVRITFTPREKESSIIERFGTSGSYVPQRGADLGVRMRNAFADCFAEGFSSCIVIGSDCPDLTDSIMEEAFRALEKGSDAVIGPAFDGGYYLIGFRKETFRPEAFYGVAWGSDRVMEQTVRCLERERCTIRILLPWQDVDRPEDMRELIKRNKTTGFAHSKTMAYLVHCGVPDDERK